MRSLDAVRDRLAAMDPTATPGAEIRALKREELLAMGSAILHELYFVNLGGDGKVPPVMAATLDTPVMVLTPVSGEAATTSWPPRRRMATVFEPIRPVPPITTIRMVSLLLWFSS